MYYLSLFPIPVTVCNKLEAIIRRFLWSGVGHTRNVHWVCWNKVCKFKADGGLGLVEMKLKNRAMLNKWLWRFASENDNLWRRVVIQKYGGDSDVFLPDVSNLRRFSPLWKGITKPLVTCDDLSSTLMDGLRYAVGNGKEISFWS